MCVCVLYRTQKDVYVPMMCYVSFIIIISFLSVAVANLTIEDSPNVQLLADPSQIQPGLTSHLSVTCTLPRRHSTDFATVLSLILSKSGDTVTDDITDDAGGVLYTELAAITSRSPQNVTVKASHGADVTGQMVVNGDSFLAFDWTDPSSSSDVIGSYRCQAFGMDSFGHPVVSTAVAEVGEAPVDLASALARIHDIKNTMETKEKEQDKVIEDLKKQLTAQNDQLANVTSQIGAAWQATFLDSAYYNGHAYFLSRRYVLDVAAYQRFCRAFGAYLVEINDKPEFDFVKSFLGKQQGLKDYVLVGASDAAKEGTWVYLESGNPVSFFDWHPGQPGTDGEEDCMCVCGVSTGSPRMCDLGCSLDHIDSFICEK